MSNIFYARISHRGRTKVPVGPDRKLRTRATARSRRAGGAWMMVRRIAIEELETWCFGDWTAVPSAFPRVSLAVPRQAPFLNPDAIKELATA